MTAGLRQRVTIYRMRPSADDAVGGAVMVSTVSATDIPATILTNRPSQASLEAGIEVPTSYDMTLRPSIDIRENDEVEVTQPADDLLAGIRLKVIGVQQGKRRRNRAAIHVTLSRSRYSRSEP